MYVHVCICKCMYIITWPRGRYQNYCTRPEGADQGPCAIIPVVSFPDPHMHPPERGSRMFRVIFLVLAESSFLKTHVPIRSLDVKISGDFKRHRLRVWERDYICTHVHVRASVLCWNQESSQLGMSHDN